MSIKSYHSIGRRKSSIARIYIQEKKQVFEKLIILVNNHDLEIYFQNNSQYIHEIMSVFKLLEITCGYVLNIKVFGGGIHSQSHAIRLGISRIFCKIMPESRVILKSEGYLKRDSRIKERRKYGLKKARKAPQFSKR